MTRTKVSSRFSSGKKCAFIGRPGKKPATLHRSLLSYPIISPSPIRTDVPVIHFAAGDTMKASRSAISSGRPWRFISVFSGNCSVACSTVICVQATSAREMTSVVLLSQPRHDLCDQVRPRTSQTHRSMRQIPLSPPDSDARRCCRGDCREHARHDSEGPTACDHHPASTFGLRALKQNVRDDAVAQQHRAYR